MASKIYGNALKAAFNKEVDFDTDEIKVMLLSSAYTPNQDGHDYLDDITTNEVTGAGYTAGGKVLANKSVTYDSATNTLKLDADDVSWANSTITARYAVVYDNAGATNAQKVLLAYFDFTTDRASSNGEFVIRWGADGIIGVTAA